MSVPVQVLVAPDGHYTPTSQGRNGMSAQSTPSPSVCPDCGGPKYRYAKFCMLCKSKGERNPRFGKKATSQTREKISKKALARPRKPRPRKNPSQTEAAGREFARRWFPMPELCQRCGQKPPYDRHHIDGNTLNNDPSNVAFLCRSCHQETDGRKEMLRELGRKRREKTHCKRGHLFDEANTFWTKDGNRACRICQQAAVIRYRERKQ